MQLEGHLSDGRNKLCILEADENESEIEAEELRMLGAAGERREGWRG